ncbi:RN115 ligase, partial [Polypterus senegalus]|nr:E3 ubiquitin-protein ligase RNF115 [Polypterus senegalus]MBN3292955.1 RN115 ligase [Polypterus senegalus]
MAEAAAVEQHRFFCHCCKGEVSPKLPEYICPRCESGFIEEVTDDSSFLEGGASGISDEAATHFAELWHLLFVDRPFSMDPDRDLTERQPLPSSEYWTSGRTTRLQTQRRYRSRGTTRPDRSPAVEGIVQQFLASLFANSGVPGSPPLSWTGMLHSNPGDYAWGQGGLDAVITQLLGQFENTGPPPAEKEKISSLPTVHVSQDQVDSGLECPVCKEDYRQGEEVRQLPCNHFFHSTCIVPWLEMHDTCPVCRKSLSGEDSTRQSLDATSLNSEGRPQERWSF